MRSPASSLRPNRQVSTIHPARNGRKQTWGVPRVGVANIGTYIVNPWAHKKKNPQNLNPSISRMPTNSLHIKTALAAWINSLTYASLPTKWYYLMILVINSGTRVFSSLLLVANLER